MDISCIDLINLPASSLGWAAAIVEPIADVVVYVVGSVVATGAIVATQATKVEGTIVVIVGIVETVTTFMLAYFSCTNLSISFSVSFNWACS